MTKKNSKSLLDSVETLVGANAVFEGNIKTDRTIRIDGKIVGNIETTAGVLVGAEALIEGNINAEIVMVGGTVKGNIKAPEGIEILPKAKMLGDISTNILTIAEGAFFEGKSQMFKSDDNDKSGEETK
ncbi:MAG: polymer-forming cytoskeletal protein [Endomicrobium sp.]|jgi:cytoskeletal protein CcmA (bactofilin family)|nr:polymer-forming cytoskeletal protein [Endomicrobium sp.]